MCCGPNWYIRSACADPTVPCNYTMVGSFQPTCPGTGKICAIKAEDDGFGCPVITPCIFDQMVIALSTDVDQPCVLLRSSC